MQQGTHHFVITLQKPLRGGLCVHTWHSEFTPEPGMTRAEAFSAIKAELEARVPDVAGGNTLFFSLESNQL